MSTLDEMPPEELANLPRTIEEAAENAAKKLPKDVQNQWRVAKIYVYVSGEHNPIHGYSVDLSGHP